MFGKTKLNNVYPFVIVNKNFTCCIQNSRIDNEDFEELDHIKR